MPVFPLLKERLSWPHFLLSYCPISLFPLKFLKRDVWTCCLQFPSSLNPIMVLPLPLHWNCPFKVNDLHITKSHGHFSVIRPNLSADQVTWLSGCYMHLVSSHLSSFFIALGLSCGLFLPLASKCRDSQVYKQSLRRVKKGWECSEKS